MAMALALAPMKLPLLLECSWRGRAIMEEYVRTRWHVATLAFRQVNGSGWLDPYRQPEA